MEEMHHRLQRARRKAGFEDATSAARRFLWNENTYRSHENGARGLSQKVALRYAKAFKVPAGWLLTGEGAPEGMEEEAETPPGHITVDRSLLEDATAFLLRAEGVPRDQAALGASIFVEALSKPPIDAVSRDPLRSFEIHFELHQGQPASDREPQ